MSKNKSHPDAQYLKQEGVGEVIAKGLAYTERQQPKNPVTFFANWLLNYSETSKIIQEDKQKYDDRQNLIEKYNSDQRLAAKQKDKSPGKAAQKEKEIEDFTTKVKESKDLTDNLQDLVNHLKFVSESTAVYVGKVAHPIKEIKDDDDDTAHIDPNAVSQIQFTHSDDGHNFMVDKILKQDQGVTYGLFKDEEPAADEEPKEEEEEEADNKFKPPPKPKPLRHILIPEVVREPRIHYYTVPRLGSYLAIKLEYNSCLFEEAFDDAIGDYAIVNGKRADLEKEQKDYADQQEELRLEKQEAGETYNPETKNWPEFKYKDFKTKKVQYVVCLNTLGQDRCYTEAMKEQILEIVKNYRDTWENLEATNLKGDIAAKFERAEYDKVYKEHLENVDQSELEKRIDEFLQASAPAEGEDPLTDNEKTMIQLKSKIQSLTQTFYAPDLAAQHKARLLRQEQERLRSQGGDRTQGSEVGSRAGGSAINDGSGGSHHTPLTPEQWQEKLRGFKTVFVLKFPKILQTLFYLLKFRERSYICDRGTNMLSWKKAKVFVNDDLFLRMNDYSQSVIGSKDDHFREYEKLKFLQKNLTGLSLEAIDEYSVAIGKLYRWILFAMEIRIEDIRQRREHKDDLRKQRLECQEKEKERNDKRNAMHDEAKLQFDDKIAADLEAKKQEAIDNPPEVAEGEEEQPPAADEEDFRPEFDATQWYEDFDDENPPIDIPDEVEEDIDNDCNIDIKGKGGDEE